MMTMRESEFSLLDTYNATETFPSLPLDFMEGMWDLAQSTLFVCYRKEVPEECMWSLAPVGTQMCIADFTSLSLVSIMLLFLAPEIFNSTVSSDPILH